MLPAPYRLRQFRDFQRVYRSGRGVEGTFVRLKIAQNQMECTRFGVVVPNKLIKKATQRNRKKRQIRAALQAFLPRLKPGFDVVVSAQPALADAEYAEIHTDIEAALTNGKLL